MDPEVLGHIRHGSWPAVLKIMAAAPVDRHVLQRVQEQVVKELLLEREHELAGTLLREWASSLSDATPGRAEGRLLQGLWDLV